MGCKNECHNLEQADGEKVYRRVLRILRRNLPILKEVLSEDPEVVRIDKILHKNLEILKRVIKDKRYAEVSTRTLDKAGFRFDFCTFVMGTYKYYYHLSYKALSEEKYQVSLASINILEKM